MNELSNTLEDLLTEQQLKEYLSKEYPFNTNFLGDILLKKLKEEPDYEVWVPFFYCKYALRCKDRGLPSLVHSPLTFISNKGGLVRLREGEYIPISTQVSPHGYLTSSARTGPKRKFIFMLHRAIGTVFTPLPPELKLYHPKDLQVNHIDGVKSNPALGNLEWVTYLGNTSHAIETGLIKTGKDSTLTKPVKGKIEFGPYTGHEFVLHGLADYRKYKFNQSNIVTCCKGRVRSHKNCSWTYATALELEQLPHGLSGEIRASLDGPRKYIYNLS